jgi:hypothetical protein
MVLLPVEGWPRTRIFLAGIEREEETELRMVDQRSCGGASGEDERESSFIVDLFVENQVGVSDRVGDTRSSSNLNHHHHGPQIIPRHPHVSGSCGT